MWNRRTVHIRVYRLSFASGYWLVISRDRLDFEEEDLLKTKRRREQKEEEKEEVDGRKRRTRRTRRKRMGRRNFPGRGGEGGTGMERV